MPGWADAMLDQLSEEYNSPRPKVCWIQSGADGYTGGWYAHGTGEIVIVANGNFTVDSHSLAHEYAHYLTEQGHNSTMYMQLFDIVERLGLDKWYMMDVELDYQPTQLISALAKGRQG